jgi:chorismate mutase/prephenate dehydratase
VDDLNKLDDVNKLEILRREINEIDTQLLELFESRMEIVQEIAEYKAGHQLAILNSVREKEVLEKTGRINNPELKAYAREFLLMLMAVSKKFQADWIKRVAETQQQPMMSAAGQSKTIDLWPDSGQTIETAICSRATADLKARTVGFQGLPGSYSEQAMRQFFGDDIKGLSYSTFEDVFKALQEEEIDCGVLPLENSFTGGIAEVYDLLCRYGFYIVGEKCARVDHHLLAPAGADLESIEEIYSHPQAFLQCSRYLKLHPRWKQIPCSNTAVSAKQVADAALATKAAIGSRRAADIYGLSILAQGINNNVHNYTRFIIIGRHAPDRIDNNKISIAVAIAHEPGSLHRILSHFAKNNLNMLKIESRPITEKTWEYLFYIDFEGNLQEEEVRKAVKEIQKESACFRLLGNYRAAQAILIL